MVLFNFMRFEPPSVRQERLQATTMRLTGEVSQLAERREMFDFQRQIRQPPPPPPPPRIPVATPEQTAIRRGDTGFDIALGLHG